MERFGLILAGGQSRRLFPFAEPKPLLEVNGTSLLEQTLDRLAGFKTFVVTGETIGTELKKYLSQKDRTIDLLVEPAGRDTAAAVGFALRHLKSKTGWLAILSADQWIPETGEFQKFLKTVESEIERHPDSLFVAGSPAEQKAKESHSQFGWILPDTNDSEASQAVRQFVEKPQGQALEEIRSKNGRINAGMFFGRIEVFLKALERHFPKPLDEQIDFETIERQPIDRAIFEKFENVRCLSLDMQWEDLGTWDDVAQHIESASKKEIDGKNNFAFSDNREEVFYFFGADNLMVVRAGEKTLIIPRDHSRKMKDFLDRSDL